MKKYLLTYLKNIYYNYNASLAQRIEHPSSKGKVVGLNPSGSANLKDLFKLMKLNYIKDLWNKDSNINKMKLDDESLSIPNLHAKYQEIYSSESLQYKKLLIQQRILLREKYEYYLGKAPAEKYKESPFDLKLLKSDIPIYLESDRELCELQFKIDIQEEKIGYLKSVLSQLSSRNWVIRNAIEWQKFINGIS